MKKRIPLFAKIGLLMISALFMFSSCTEDKYYPVEYVDSIEIFKEFHDIKASDWYWNQDRGRYEVEFNVPPIDQYKYDEGILNASIFIKYDDGTEVQTVLPYLETWIADDGLPYTEYIKFDVDLRTKTVFYYIEASDLGRDDQYLADYQIKFSFIYYIR